tara:strand:+ start:463 stop:1206 length:744 start_codon:yes stop_codon:yes gene_type:complete
MISRLKDNLFNEEKNRGPFEFDESVAQVFDDMLERSVPFYHECQEATIQLCSTFATDNSTVYDLGCSTGILLKHLAETLPESIRLVGIDSSEPMLEKARERLRHYSSKRSLNLNLSDLNSENLFKGASVIIMNYTLQFIPPQNREKLVRQIKSSLSPGGALILIEKVKGRGKLLEKEFVSLHHQFKHNRGYSNSEIARKKEVLENVLVPLGGEENVELLRMAGFEEVDVFFRWFNFAGFVAIKGYLK